MDNTLENITWDNSKAYKGFDDPKMSSDLEMAEKVIPEIEKEAEPFEGLLEKSDADLNSYLESSRNLLRKKMDLSIDLQMLSSYSYFKLSTEADHKDAKEVSSRAQKLSSDLKKAIAPLEIFLVKSADSFFNDLIKDERVQETKFLFESLRKRIDFLLTTKEEVALTGLSVDGLHAWGKLYRDIAGNMEIDIEGEKMGLAQASSLLRGPDREQRKKAWIAVNKSWEGYKESTSAILNAINGWRIESNKMRSTKRPLHYLDQSCHESRITNKTLDALMDSTYEKRDVGQKALKVMTKIMGVEKLGPWDLLSPCPLKKDKEEKISFPEAIDIVKRSFSKFNPEMGEFVEMMANKKWIDSLPTPKRNPGAYCSRFSKLREPRVFMTYTGSMGNVLTLAHELGHA
ncbi:MAG: M3 family metallopeptidase, partial [Bdellovibrionota bacterium]|nr:M3 family metallopeptidase [Bdellovibrionota bacterium]